MADSQIYRASTTAPVNIAVIKYLLQFPTKGKQLTTLTTPQILGQTRPNPPPPHQLRPLSHPFSIPPPRPHHRLLLPNLPPRRLPPPQLPAPRPLFCPPLSLSQGPTLPPLLPRILLPLPHQTLHDAPPHRLREQLPHSRRSRFLGRRLRGTGPSDSGSIPAATIPDRALLDSETGFRFRVPKSARRVRGLGHGLPDRRHG